MDQPEPSAESDTLAALLERLGGAWHRSGAEDAWREEPGLMLRVGVTVDEEGRGTVRMEVRPMVGWVWYVGPVLGPLVAVQFGCSVGQALLGGAIVATLVRIVVGRLVLRRRVVARHTTLESQIAAAMRALGGTPASA